MSALYWEMISTDFSDVTLVFEDDKFRRVLVIFGYPEVEKIELEIFFSCVSIVCNKRCGRI